MRCCHITTLYDGRTSLTITRSGWEPWRIIVNLQCCYRGFVQTTGKLRTGMQRIRVMNASLPRPLSPEHKQNKTRIYEALGNHLSWNFENKLLILCFSSRVKWRWLQNWINELQQSVRLFILFIFWFINNTTFKLSMLLLKISLYNEEFTKVMFCHWFCLTP